MALHLATKSPAPCSSARALQYPSSLASRSSWLHQWRSWCARVCTPPCRGLCRALTMCVLCLAVLAPRFDCGSSSACAGCRMVVEAMGNWWEAETGSHWIRCVGGGDSPPHQAVSLEHALSVRLERTPLGWEARCVCAMRARDERQDYTRRPCGHRQTVWSHADRVVTRRPCGHRQTVWSQGACTCTHKCSGWKGLRTDNFAISAHTHKHALAGRVCTQTTTQSWGVDTRSGWKGLCTSGAPMRACAR